ncbi:glycosyltransferase family 9 protein [Flavobacteriaceae bacterium 14752]|uniref:glycosyltransferase family 9 protein n=1 Tax=Mesohalobacter salilacus TaxID=2491711 RepID=UPI000F636292|nr:lipopolysaccharide heptosyltransferase family protein [Flavobacteriaceae bacterium 14752]
MKILVIQQKMIGDVLTSSLICENLKLNFPDAEIHYLINRFTLPVVEGHPCVDEFVIFEDKYRQSKVQFYKFLKQISKAKYTHVFDAYGKLESLLISRFSKAKNRFGFKKSYSQFFYTNTVRIQHSSHTEAGTAIENRLRLTQLMPHTKIYNNKPKIYLSEVEIKTAKQKLLNAGLNSKTCIMVSALGSEASKTYPLNYMAELLNLIVKHTKAYLILNYIPAQQDQIDSLINLCDLKTQNYIVKDLDINSLRDFICICSQCKAIVGNEGGAINTAKALNVPTFSIFSPWIIKEGWNSFEQNHPNVSVHLSDFNDNWFENHNIKDLKQNAEKYYNELNPNLFKFQLIDFLKTNIG